MVAFRRRKLVCRSQGRRGTMVKAIWEGTVLAESNDTQVLLGHENHHAAWQYPVTFSKSSWSWSLLRERSGKLSGVQIVEGNHYFPPASIKKELFKPSDYTTHCGRPPPAVLHPIATLGLAFMFLIGCSTLTPPEQFEPIQDGRGLPATRPLLWMARCTSFAVDQDADRGISCSPHTTSRALPGSCSTKPIICGECVGVGEIYIPKHEKEGPVISALKKSVSDHTSPTHQYAT